VERSALTFRFSDAGVAVVIRLCDEVESQQSAVDGIAERHIPAGRSTSILRRSDHRHRLCAEIGSVGRRSTLCEGGLMGIEECALIGDPHTTALVAAVGRLIGCVPSWGRPDRDCPMTYAEQARR